VTQLVAGVSAVGEDVPQAKQYPRKRYGVSAETIRKWRKRGA
jgi:hypothetical protein